MKLIIPIITPFLMMGTLALALFPQSAGNPLMMAPFLILASILILSGKIFKAPNEDMTLLLVMGLWLIWGISGIYSAVPFPSKVTWVILGTLPATYILARTTNHSPLQFLSLMCVPFAVYTIWQATHGIHRPNTPFDDANSLGLFYAFGILSVLPMTTHQTDKKIRLLSGTVIFVLLVALILTQSRSALLSLTCGGIFYALINTPITTYLNKKTLLKIGAGLLSLIALIFATGFANRLTFPTGRLAIWQGAWNMLTEHPFLGFGLGTFHLYYPPYRIEGDTSLGWMTHMEPLQTAIESGWITTVILYALFIIPFIFLYKNRNSLTPQQMGAGAIIVAFFMGMHINYPIHVVPFLMILGMALAVLSPKPSPSPLPIVVSCGILITLLSAIWIMTHTSMTLMLAEETQKAYRLHDQDRFNTAITSCINDGDTDFPDCRLMAARFLTIARDPDTTKIESLLKTAEKSNPTSPEPDYLRAQILLGQTPTNMNNALSLLHHSLSLNPSYWPSRRLSIEILIKKGDTSAANAMLDDGLIYPYATLTRDDISRIRKTLDGHQ